MAQIILSEQASLTIDEFRLLMQPLVRFGFPVSDDRRLILRELQAPSIAPYVIAVQPYSDVEIENLIYRTEYEFNNLNVEWDEVRRSDNRDRKTRLHNQLTLLNSTLNALKQNPMATIEAYIEPNGILITWVDYYSGISDNLFKTQSVLAHFAGELVKLAAHVRQLVQETVSHKIEAEDRPNGNQARDSDHFAYPPEKRRQIVEHYWADRAQGKITTRDAWAKTKYGISGKTLLRYEKEFRDRS